MRTLCRRQLFDAWKAADRNTRSESVLRFVISYCELEGCPEDIIKSIKHTVSVVCAKISSRWTKCNRHINRFLECNSSWLNENVVFEEIVYNAMPSTSNRSAPATKTRGRPRKLFDDCGDSTKRRKAKNLRDEVGTSELVAATQMSLHSLGKRDAAKLVGEISFASPQRSTKIKKLRQSAETPSTNMTAEQALAFMMDLHLTSNQYKSIRENAKDFSSNLYPPYYQVQEEKKKCYPSENSIHITEHLAEVKLQALLDHTASRLCETQADVLRSVDLSELHLTLVSKWGCDGSADQSRYKQKFSSGPHSDENIFSLSLVPVKLCLESEESEKVLIWQNPRANSTRYCRPIKLLFAKESRALIIEEVEKIRSQEKCLVTTKIENIEGVTIYVKHNLVLTMVDGKVCSALSMYQSSQRCYVCGALPKDMNSDTLRAEIVNPDALSFGLSPLHAWIRCFECLLHIAYRLDVKKWAIRRNDDKEKVNGRKRAIQQM